MAFKDPKLWELWSIPYYGYYLKDPKLWELWSIPYYGYYLKDPKLWEFMVYSLLWVLP